MGEERGRVVESLDEADFNRVWQLACAMFAKDWGTPEVRRFEEVLFDAIFIGANELRMIRSIGSSIVVSRADGATGIKTLQQEGRRYVLRYRPSEDD